MKSFYDQWVLPHLLHLACGTEGFTGQRSRLIPKARGQVLEVGAGSGLNFRFYDADQVGHIWALEPSVEMRRKASRQVRGSGLDIRWLDAPAEAIPLDDDSVDSVVLVYTLCTIPDWRRALSEMRRVLRPDGQLLFCEHGAAPDPKLFRWQNRLNPVWRKLLGGCQLQRPIPALLEQGGFKINKLEQGYIDAPRLAAFNYWGAAVAARTGGEAG